LLRTVTYEAFDQRWSEFAPNFVHPIIDVFADLWSNALNQLSVCHWRGPECFQDVFVHTVDFCSTDTELGHNPEYGLESTLFHCGYVERKFIRRNQMKRLPHQMSFHQRACVMKCSVDLTGLDRLQSGS